jgi:predicted dehydrogenase
MINSKVLLIGCGNIGAVYDMFTDKVETFAKGFYRLGVLFSVYDIDPEKSEKTAKLYGAQNMESISEAILKSFDIVCIATSTPTHFEYLEKCLNCSVPLIICEKPIVSNINDLYKIHSIKKRTDVKVMINYIRRFQPGYSLLKDRLQKILCDKSFSVIRITYQRGILNNGSHALDIISYLLPTTCLEELIVTNYTYDAFDYDPTISGSILVNGGSKIILNGVTSTEQDIFEVEILTDNAKILISEFGNSIRYFHTDSNGVFVESIDCSQNGVLDDYMIPVIENAFHILHDEQSDNFNDAFRTNEFLLRQLKKINYAKISD